MIRRSVTVKILAWCLVALVISLAGFFIVTASRMHHLAPFFFSVNSMQRDDAIVAYERGGPQALELYLEHLAQYLSVRCFLTDSHGRDLVTGEDRTALLARGNRRSRGEEMVIVTRSLDGRYRFIVKTQPPRESMWSFVPFYLLVPLAVGLLGWLLAVNIASPLRKMAHVVDRFGRGDLSARVNLRRRDEIGGLARAFDQMAERTQTLLTAERRLLQDISHELRSPLTRISFAAALTRTAGNRDAAVDRLEKEVGRLSELVDALLQVTRAEGDPDARVSERVWLNELLAEIVADSEMESGARNCTITLNNPAIVYVQGDYGLLRRAIDNVLRNAIRFAPEYSNIDVRLEMTGEMANVSIRDCGPGVPEEALPKLFQPFFRVDENRDSSTGGTGLGLAIAQRAMALHGGSIAARNANPGLLVTISLPASDAKQSEDRMPKPVGDRA